MFTVVIKMFRKLNTAIHGVQQPFEIAEYSATSDAELLELQMRFSSNENVHSDIEVTKIAGLLHE